MRVIQSWLTADQATWPDGPAAWLALAVAGVVVCRCCCLQLSGAWSLHAGAHYVLPNSQTLASLDNALQQVRRQLGNQERGKEFGKALLSDVTGHGLRDARLRPELRKIKVTACPVVLPLTCVQDAAGNELLHELLAVSEALALALPC